MADKSDKIHEHTANEALISEMRKGTAPGVAMAEYCTRWQISERTFARYWARAKEELNRRAAAVMAKAEALEAEEYAGRNIATKAEIMQILSEIARGELKGKKTVYDSLLGCGVEIDTTPDFLDRRGAAAELNKMQGNYAPVQKEIKKETTVTKHVTGIEVK